MIKKIPGTKDILPQEVCLWQEIENSSRKVFSLYNYQEIRFPVIEEVALFSRTLGETTEIVQKQMFLIQKDKDAYALRPEGTASVVRAYIENNLDKNYGFAKLYYIGPMFRYERPQKGRLRQFHHVGVEAIGSYAPEADVEIISLANALLSAYGIKNHKIHLNSLGCSKDKTNFTNLLRDKLKGKLPELCEDCQVRFKQNVLRILDCKNEACRNVIKNLKIDNAHLCDDCSKHFSEVRKGLDSLGIKYEFAPHLVRGLDYYTRTVFEITHEALGAQDALGAGGRYDNLVSDLGGPKVGAAGFALGMERLLLAQDKKELAASSGLTYIIPLGAEAKIKALQLLDILRKHNLTADTDYEGKSLKGAMRAANDLKAQFVLIIGEDELKKGTVTLKDMQKSLQEEIKETELIEKLNSKLK